MDFILRLISLNFAGEKASSKLPYKPLANKKFYLDIKSNKGKANITADIHNLGGVSYVVPYHYRKCS